MPQVVSALESRFVAASLRVQRAWPVPGAGLTVELFAHGPAPHKLFGLIGWDDHFFVVNAERCGLRTPDRLGAAHEAARRYVNGCYAVPPAFRLMAVPTIVTVAVSAEGFAPALVDYVRQTDRGTFVGGEANIIILVDMSRREIVAHDPRHRSRIGLPTWRVSAAVREACQHVLGA